MFLKESLRYSTLASSYDEINNFDKAFEYFGLANSINLEVNKNKLDKNKSIKLVHPLIFESTVFTKNGLQKKDLGASIPPRCRKCCCASF